MARILITDDEANIRKAMTMALRQEGHTVDQASDGAEALAKFGTGQNWDLVILDHRMPGMEGLEVLREIHHRAPSARVIMATAFGTIDLAVDAMKSGASDFLRKPFELDTLIGAVASSLREPAAPPMRHEEASGATRFSFTTLNGFRIESLRTPTERRNGEIRQMLTVRAPNGNMSPCEVVLPAYIVELIKAETDRESMPNGDLFWQGLCEEALANYVWQNASIPMGGTLKVEEYTPSLRRWTGAVLA